MDQDSCLEILRGVEIGEKTLRLISRFWWECVLVCRAAGLYGTLFKASHGVMQGGPLLPAIFNVIANAIIREWEK